MGGRGSTSKGGAKPIKEHDNGKARFHLTEIVTKHVGNRTEKYVVSQTKNIKE